MPRIFGLILFLFSNVLLAEDLHVAVASNFKQPLLLLKPAIEQELSVKLIISSASTGKLATQVLQGAPFDVILTADNFTHMLILKRGMGQLHMPYTQGQLALYSYQEMDDAHVGLAHVEAENVERIALANPKLAPYGLAAVEAMKKAGVRPLNKPVVAENVTQVFNYVKTGHVDLGFVSYSSLILAGVSERYFYLLPQEDYPSIQQYMLLMNNKKQSLDFAIYLLSEKIQSEINAMGYKSVER